jgi:single-stranded-DNA-specific exonuclease
MTTRNAIYDIPWYLPEQIEFTPTDPGVLSLDAHPLVVRLLRERGIDTQAKAAAFLDPVQYAPTPPQDFPDLAIAVQLLLDHITTRNKILIWGDFDVDGQTSTALLIDALSQLGADVAFYVPHRLRESHGIQLDSLAAQIAQHQPALLLTCDTGITAHEAVDYAKSQGLTVIVTDHHDLPAGDLPAADANINPKRLPVDHPLRTLPGVGVAYKLMQALYAACKRDDEIEQFLDLVAMGIVADVAEQVRDTRYLLQRGLAVLRSTQRIGLKALFAAAGVQPAHITTETIGFQLGPRLNAVGRLGDASQAVELLTTQDSTQASVLAAQLDALNRRRQVMQRQIMAAAEEIIASDPSLLDFTALVLYQPDWHAGLLGIVAGQLAEKYQRPCIMLAAADDTAQARGSARSAPGYDIGAAIAAQADILDGFGGHPGAAGLSLPADNIITFRRRISRTLDAQYRPTVKPGLSIDAILPLEEITTELLAELDRLAPFGEGNPPIVLAVEHLKLASHTYLGREQLHRKLTVEAPSGEKRAVLWWNGGTYRLPQEPFDIAFTLGWNTYQGRREMAITLQGIREHAPAVPEIAAPTRHIEDWRNRPANEVLAQFQAAEPDGQIWADGQTDLPSGTAKRRHELEPGKALLIYTPPPAGHVLHRALETVDPVRIYIASILPEQTGGPQLLKQLVGLCKYTINELAGQADIDRMAAAIAQKPEVVLWGLRLLTAKGIITLIETDAAILVKRPDGSVTDQTAEQEAAAALKAALTEVAAYRAFFTRSQIDTLLS